MAEKEKKSFTGFNRIIIAIVAVFVSMLASLIAINYYSNYLEKAVKGYVQGSLIWSNAQQTASYHLVRYLYNHKEDEYKKFRQPLQIIKGDRQAALTLISDNPDYEKAREGFIEGNINDEYIDPMIWLIINFKDVNRLAQSIELWKKADQKMQELTGLAEELHSRITRGQFTFDEQDIFLTRIELLNETVDNHVQAYVDVMNETGRWVDNAVFWLNIVLIAFLVASGGAIILVFINQAKQWDRSISRHKALLNSVLDNTRDIIYQLNLETGNYVYISPHVKKQLGYSPEKIMSEGPDFVVNLIHPEDLERLGQEVKQVRGEEQNLEDSFSGQTEFRIKRKDGQYIWVNNQRSLVRNAAGDPVAIVGCVRDITDRKKHEEQTEKSLREKQVLLEEIHHRVKNNLAIVSGILELQKQESQEESVKAVLEDTQFRIRSIAKIHEKLYSTETLSKINIKEYIEEFSDMIQQVYHGGGQNISIHKNLEQLSLDIIRAVPLGLIYNELLNNAFKHGFSGKKEGEIKVCLKKENETLILSVENNGKPLPDDFEIERIHTLGMTLANSLTNQLDGDLAVSQNGWTRFEISFPLQKNNTE